MATALPFKRVFPVGNGPLNPACAGQEPIKVRPASRPNEIQSEVAGTRLDVSFACRRNDCACHSTGVVSDGVQPNPPPAKELRSFRPNSVNVLRWLWRRPSREVITAESTLSHLAQRRPHCVRFWMSNGCSSCLFLANSAADFGLVRTIVRFSGPMST